MKSNMHHIAICIPTYRRPSMLQKLVLSIYALRVDEDLIRKISIVIVDNDAEQTAYNTVSNLRSDAKLFDLRYHCNPVKGLVNVRNALIREALYLNPDFLAFIDDDQFVSSEWLSEMINTLVSTRGDLAIGPVIPVFEKRVPSWISCWFRHHQIRDQTPINFLETGNLTIRASYLEANPELRFDRRFNTTGAEDSYFGVQVIKKGTKIWWSAKAKTFETIPPQRAKINWLIRRSYRGANTFSFIILLEREYLKIAKKITINFIYFFIGTIALILTPLHIKYRYFGLLKLAESAGGFTGLFKLKYHEYKKGR